MIHETFLCLTETAFGSHPCRVVSVTYRKLRPFHGGNTGSHPVGDATLEPTTSNSLLKTHRHKKAQLSEETRTFDFGGGFLSCLCIRKKLSDYRGLSRSLCRGYGLRVRVECHTRGRVSKQFLHHYLCPLRLPLTTSNTNVGKCANLSVW